MDARQAYDFWASLYDSNKNNTRDLEAKAMRETLQNLRFTNCLEVGCGTGKNTVWLMERARVLGVDLSPEMLARAKEKVNASNVVFRIADVTAPWDFTDELFDLITFSLVLEHIEQLTPLFQKVYDHLTPGGSVYVGELHPFKQYTGTKARFDTESGKQIVDCYNHHVSDFIQAGRSAGLESLDLNEYFDTEDRTEIPRILTIIFQRPV